MISTFGCASNARSLCAGVSTIGFLVLLLRRCDSSRFDCGGEGFVVLLEDHVVLLLGQPAWNDSELAEPLGDFRRPGERRDLLPDRADDRLRRSCGRRKPIPG